MDSSSKVELSAVNGTAAGSSPAYPARFGVVTANKKTLTTIGCLSGQTQPRKYRNGSAKNLIGSSSVEHLTSNQTVRVRFPSKTNVPVINNVTD